MMRMPVKRRHQAALERGEAMLARLTARALKTGKPQSLRAPDGTVLITVKPAP